MHQRSHSRIEFFHQSMGLTGSKNYKSDMFGETSDKTCMYYYVYTNEWELRVVKKTTISIQRLHHYSMQNNVLHGWRCEDIRLFHKYLECILGLLTRTRYNNYVVNILNDEY